MVLAATPLAYKEVVLQEKTGISKRLHVAGLFQKKKSIFRDNSEFDGEKNCPTDWLILNNKPSEGAHQVNYSVELLWQRRSCSNRILRTLDETGILSPGLTERAAW